MTHTLACIVLSAAVATISCSGDKPKPKSSADDDPAPSWSDDTSPEDSSASDDAPSDDGDDDDSDSPPPKKKRHPEREDDYQISYRDCAALGATYGRAWRNEELKKLNDKGLKPKQAETAAAGIEQNAQEVHDNWKSECDKTVGTAFLRSRLKCAIKARTVQRFNDCWDGKVQ